MGEEKQPTEEQILNEILERQERMRTEVNFYQLLRFSMMEQSIINFQNYINKKATLDYEFQVSNVGPFRERVINNNETSKVKLRVPSIRSLVRDAERQRDLSVNSGKKFIESQLKLVNDYKANLTDEGLKHYSEYAALLGAISHKVLHMDDPKKFLILLQMYNEGFFDKVFSEVDKAIEKAEDKISEEIVKNDPEEILP